MALLHERIFKCLSSLSASTPPSELQALNVYLATGRMPKAPSKGMKVNAHVEKSLLEKLAGKPMNDVVKRVGIVNLVRR